MAGPAFRDHFSRVAKTYAAVRPHYPAELYAYLAALAPAHDIAWDAATGNGQAAVGRARHFDRVIATDASAAQIAQATLNPRVEYRVARAEESGLPAATIDLVAVAQAVHWFDLEAFYREVRRVARRGAITALWSYGYFTMTPEIDAAIARFAEGTLLEFWPPETRVIGERYRPLPFPFDEIEAPTFPMDQPITLAQVESYFRSWSGVQRYLDARGSDPVPAMMTELTKLWGDPASVRSAHFEIFLRVGRV